ncbi:MAG: segregation/condensation protein A [Candidatus Nomurabacteria bacterium]|nr:MAG: segregation/condensation protein A [Candidatus Nomurabacteria bacterium]
MYQIKLQQFEGPLDLLLRLIEQNQLDISQLALAEVTEQFIAEIEAAEYMSPEELADFLVVAAKLLYIKSKILLPRDEEDEEEDPGISLEQQLRLYRAYIDAAKHIAERWQKGDRMFVREQASLPESIFLPPPGVTPTLLQELLLHVIAGIEPIVNVNEGVVRATVNIREKITQIRDMLTAQPDIRFNSLLEKITTKTELVVTFLAMLELVKQRSVLLHQEDNFSDIVISSYNESPNENV